jgi:Icc protein
MAPAQLAHITDPHVGDDESARALADAVRAVVALDPAPDAVLLSGDLVDDPTPETYARVRDLLAPLTMPVHVLPGNHDDRAALRACFDGGSGAGAEPYQYVARVGPWRLIACDSTVPGQIPGSLDGGRLDWLEAQLDDDRETPAIVALHHPPLLTAITEVDQMGLAAGDRTALGELISRHPQVQRVVAGHVHRTMVGDLRGCPVFACPSTYIQGLLDIDGRMALVREPPGFGLHVEVDGGVTSHVQPIGDYGPPIYF